MVKKQVRGASQQWWCDKSSCNPAHQEHRRKYQRGHRLQLESGGIKWSVFVDNKEEIREALASFRANQKEEKHGFNQTVA
jgi:hypothetical protein